MKGAALPPGVAETDIWQKIEFHSVHTNKEQQVCEHRWNELSRQPSYFVHVVGVSPISQMSQFGVFGVFFPQIGTTGQSTLGMMELETRNDKVTNAAELGYLKHDKTSPSKLQS